MPDADAAASVPRVLIAAASELARSWFAAFPTQTDALSIVGIAALDADLPTRVQEFAPDIVVLDVADADGEEHTQILQSVGDPAVDIVMVGNGESWRTAQPDLMRAGVRAILFHQPTLEELEAVIRAVAAGFVVLDPNFLAALPAMTTANEVAATPLTPREIDVLNALAEGLGNKQIAARLAISEHTVKTHLAAIFEKLEASNRTEAVMAGARLGLVLL
jgi:NarL family two-component system response regulator YdfI